MKHIIKNTMIMNALGVLLFALLLSGCGEMAFSPADAAVRTVMERPMPEFTVDANSVEVVQQVNLKDVSVVMVAYTGIRATAGREQCLFTYNVERSPLGGWFGGSGGGGCASAEANADPQPIDIQGGMSTNEKGSISEVYGWVNDDEITSVQVTWKDGATQKEDVANGSYLIVREGEFQMQQVDAFNADGELIFSSDPQFVAPGKE